MNTAIISDFRNHKKDTPYQMTFQHYQKKFFNLKSNKFYKRLILSNKLFFKYIRSFKNILS